MMKFIAPFLILAAAVLFGGPAKAQSFVIGVTTCGTAPTTIVNGRPAYLTVDLNGELCPAASGGGTPAPTNITQWASVALGAPSAYGTSPGAVIVPGVNAFVTNFPATQPVSGTVTANQGTANATPWPVSLTSTSVTGNVAVVGPTADGSPATTPPVLIAGTSDGTATGIVDVWKVTPAGIGYVNNAPSAASDAGLTPTTTSALAANLVVKASAGNLYSFEVSADSTLSGAAWWIMIYNATSAPGDGAVTPLKCYAMASGVTAYSAAFPVPVAFGTGITIGVSTTGCFTKTASTHAFISGDAQ